MENEHNLGVFPAIALLILTASKRPIHGDFTSIIAPARFKCRISTTPATRSSRPLASTYMLSVAAQNATDHLKERCSEPDLWPPFWEYNRKGPRAIRGAQRLLERNTGVFPTPSCILSSFYPTPTLEPIVWVVG